ncbi:MAG TPA: P-II family nitrogen regulator [Acholeplasmataceae bacterium]|nr:P-II family nitrogen regulator [Acholeplasmataceae bacterium]
MNLEIYCAIVNEGLGNKVLKILKEQGVNGATIFKGKGTVHDKISTFFALDDVRKEIVISGCDEETGDKAFLEVCNRLKLDKPKRGICFSITLEAIIGSNFYDSSRKINVKEEDNMENKLIVVIVERGNGEAVVDAALKAGATGATIVNARGSGIHETQKVFNIEIEPEKEIVLLLVESENTDTITDEIRKELRIDEPGRGIIFILDVHKTFGLYKGE